MKIILSYPDVKFNTFTLILLIHYIKLFISFNI